MKNIVQSLTAAGNIKVSKIYESYDIESRVNNKVGEIMVNKTPTFLRSLGMDVRNGVVTEFAVADAIGGSINQLSHDVKDWNSYAYDVIGSNGEKIEVKRLPISYGEKYFRFNLKNFAENPPKATYLDTFVKNSSKLDFLVLVEIRGDLIIPRYCIDAKTFTRYMGKADYDYVPTHWYNLPKATREGNCFSIQ